MLGAHSLEHLAGSVVFAVARVVLVPCRCGHGLRCDAFGLRVLIGSCGRRRHALDNVVGRECFHCCHTW